MFKAAIFSLLVASSAMVNATYTTIYDGRVIDCPQDNCVRAVGRMWAGPAVYAQHIQQCSTNLACSATPAASTSTATTTVTAGVTTITVVAQTNTPAAQPAVTTCPTSGIPADQTAACGNWATYSNACLCNGVTGVTKTAATPTVTATVTSTVPQVVFVTAAPDAIIAL